jgi:hypothetical protein
MHFAILAGAGMRLLSPLNVGGDVSMLNKLAINAGKAINAFPALIGAFEMLEGSDLLEGIVIFLANLF